MMAREEYTRLATVETMLDCPVCSATAELWQYSPNDDGALKVVMCSHGQAFGPQSGIAGEGCLLFMPPNDFYRPTKREAIKYWNDYAQALERMRRNRNWEKHKAGVLRAAQVDVCPNCDMPMPGGCGGRFKDDGDACWCNKRGEM